MVNKAATVLDVSGVQTSYTYTGDLQTVNTGATLNHSEAAPVYSNNTFTTVKEGDGLVVTITVPETANYLPAEATVTLKVTRAKAPTIEWPEVSPITYGDPLSKIELKGGSSDLGTFVWGDGSEIPGAGVPTRKLIFTPSDTENYEWPETQFSKDITVQVAKRQVTITVEDAEKTYGDPDPVYFVNPVDCAAYVGSNDVVSTWGMQYVENFAGLGSMIATTAVASGTIYCTDKQNINVYSINPAGIDGFTFYTDETGLVGVQHETTYRNLSLDTVAVTGFTIFPEIASLVVKATISA